MPGYRVSGGLAVLALAMALTACAATGKGDSVRANAAAAPAAEVDGAFVPGGDYVRRMETPAYEFRQAISPEAAATPGLRQLLNTRAQQVHQALADDAERGQKDAQGTGYPFHPYSHDEEWSTQGELSDWLSLSAIIWTYTGGAHGMIVFDALVWDKRQKKAITPEDMFVSQAALSAVVRAAYCSAIDKERAEKRQIPVEDVKQDKTFGQCIDIDSAALVLVSSSDDRSRARFDHIRFLIPPYEAGPYAEGTYEVNLPVDAAIMGVTRPEYRGAFALAR